MKNTILSYLPPDHPWGQTVYWYNTIPSTNAEAKIMAAAGAPHGTVLLADSQSEGRGRLGRSFHSPAGSGLYLSVILRPNCTPAELMHMDWLCENVVGGFPKYDEIQPIARPMVDILGVSHSLNEAGRK